MALHPCFQPASLTPHPDPLQLFSEKSWAHALFTIVTIHYNGIWTTHQLVEGDVFILYRGADWTEIMYTADLSLSVRTKTKRVVRGQLFSRRTEKQL